MKRTILSILAVATVLTGCTLLKGEEKQSGVERISQVEKLLAEMTLEEKVGQMAQVTLDVITEGPNVFASNEPLKLDEKLVRDALLKYHVGSILNTANNRARTTEKWNEVIGQIQQIATEESRLKIPVIYGVDAIHGTTYTAGATMFPQEIAQGATFNRDLVRKGAEVCAYETRASSIPWNFSPVLDMGRDPRFPRIWEGFGEDVYLTTQLGVEMIKGYEGANNDVSNPNKVASCLKHFLGYAVPTSGKDRTPTFIPEVELRERHIPAFQAAIEAGAHTVMINSGIINGTPVHANYDLLTRLLKEELQFNGVAVTDWADIDNLYNRDKVASSPKDAVKLAINAGIDMAMIPYSFQFCTDLVELVNEGEVPISRIDDAVRRILNLKYQLGLFDAPVMNIQDYPDFGGEEAEQAAYSAAAEAITLLKNEANILPLKKGSKILVAGPNANSMRSLNGGWTYSWQGEKVEEFAAEYNTILEAIQVANGTQNVKHAAGVSYVETGKYWEETSAISETTKAAQGVDYIVLCLGENSYTEKPGDLHDLTISQNQIELAKALAKTGKPIVLVLNEGRPRLIKDIVPEVKAVVQTYLPGNFGGDALADILFGEVNPSGKLPYTYPMYANTLVTYDHKPSEEQNKMEGMYDYESDFAIQFPFGFGLSYTTFEYSNLSLSQKLLGPDAELTISVDIKNTGDRAGKESVLLFISDQIASITPDIKRLRGFDKISLEPGESKTVSFQITGRDVAFVAKDLQWTVEAGDFTVMVGDQEDQFTISETKAFGQPEAVL